ncbi:unnamed protein product [Rotaria sp. Silwood1]|nr:unnamed protein product [Rotaria sp. Silwood1]CAF1689014.1 unnamed protein product [Rotaria sp. Silwood1]
MAAAVPSSSDLTEAKPPAISFINSHKGKPLLIADEYVFKLNKTTTSTKYWICTLNGCSAKIHTDTNSKLIKTIGEENRFHHMRIQFSAGLGPRPKQAKPIAIQRRIDNLGERYYDCAINAMEYLDGLSLIVAKRKK